MYVVSHQMVDCHKPSANVLQIHTPQQWAAGIVYYYPYIPRHKRWPEILAAQEGEPSIQQLMTDESLTDAQHAANWDMLVDYLSNLTIEQKAYHVPLPR